MATLLELVQNANISEEGVKTLRQELEKFSIFLNKEISLLTPAELSSFLSLLTTEKNNLSVKTIQTAAQLEEKQKTLNNKIEEIQKKYNVGSILELDGKKAEIEKELEKQMQELKEVLEKIKGV